MQIIVAVLLGTGIFGSAFFRLGVGRITVFVVLLALCSIGYIIRLIRRFSVRTRAGKIAGDGFLWAFILFGGIVVIASYLGFYRNTFAINELFDTSYIPRQAYYLVFLPVIPLIGRSYQAQTVLSWMQQHYRVLFICTYAAYVIVNRTIALSVSCLFCLCTILLMGRERNKVVDLLFLLILLLGPIHVGGEMTQMICRAYCFFFFVMKEDKQYLRPFIFLSLCIACACYIAPFVPLQELRLDANTSWRLLYWRDELTQLLRTYGIGVGYGTSYATANFVGSAVSGPFAGDSEYSPLEKIFVVGCHNSFVSLLFRLGVIGIVLLFGYLIQCAGRNLTNERTNYAVFAVASSLAIICFNVGFENPTNFTIFIFSFTVIEAMTKVSDVTIATPNTYIRNNRSAIRNNRSARVMLS